LRKSFTVAYCLISNVKSDDAGLIVSDACPTTILKARLKENMLTAR